MQASNVAGSPGSRLQQMNVLILYGSNATFANTVLEHLRSYARYSRHQIAFCSIAPFDGSRFPQLAPFDVVVLHYSFFPGLNWTVPAELETALCDFAGLKILYLQDEYDHTEIARRWMERFGVGCLFTCVPEPAVAQVYPSSRFSGVDFRRTLTGYVPAGTEGLPCIPLGERPIVIGYRGRVLHPRYGDLVREKYLIGKRMREICEKRGICVDIEWLENKRIYGRGWYEFVANCRATLGSESGSNVFDEDGSLRLRIDEDMKRNPDISYEELHRRHLAQLDGAIRMNQISPRAFEAISTRTALILFEGEYSGVLMPEDHYIALRKDFTNIEQVLRAVQDVPSLEEMTERAYRDVITSGKYSYQAFVKDFDTYLDTKVKPGARLLNNGLAIRMRADQELTDLHLDACAITNQPIRNQWLAPTRTALIPQSDTANAEFWTELCGNALGNFISRFSRRMGRRAPAASGSSASENGSSSSGGYWTGFNVTLHHEFGSAAESLEYFHWRNDQYPGYIELMPVSGQDGKIVLDYGCGPGHDVVGFGAYSKPRRLIGVDVSPTSLAEAAHRAALHGLNVEFLRIDERDNSIPLETGSVDYVHCSGVIHHTPDPVKVLRELARVLAPLGRMRIMVYNYNSLWLHLYVAYTLRIKQAAYPGLDLRQVFTRTTDGENCPIANVYRPDEFCALAREAGLACRFLGAAISNFELRVLPERFDAIMDRRLPAEHRDFLKNLELDRYGRPLHAGACAGVDGCYELTRI